MELYVYLLHIISVRCLQLICITQIALFSFRASTQTNIIHNELQPYISINIISIFFRTNPIKIKIISQTSQAILWLANASAHIEFVYKVHSLWVMM